MLPTVCLARSLFRWFRGSAAYGPGSSEMRQPTLPPLWEWRTGPKNNMLSWASAHRGKWVSWPLPGKIDEKLKNENMQKRAVFYVYVILCGQSGQAGVQNGAMLTTYLFR